MVILIFLFNFLCTGQLGVALARTLIDNNFQLDANHNNVIESDCDRGSGTSFSDACCGVVPTWKPYNTLSQQCIAGVVSNN